ncbi:MAG: hypothetical protein ACFB4I_09385 [Cyanophyceae cyanobacterium]
MSNNAVEVCPVCGVKIVKMLGGDKVLFSAGPPGDRAKLWTRVCSYAQKPGCINKDYGNNSSATAPPLRSSLFGKAP